MIREQILDKAKEIVTGHREREYGSPEDNFTAISELWTTYLGHMVKITPADVACMMALLKIARIASGISTADSYIDLAGYAACAAEVAGVEMDLAEDPEEPEEEPESEPEKPAKGSRSKKIDIGKIMALKDGGWSTSKIADEMGMTPQAVSNAIWRYKKTLPGG